MKSKKPPLKLSLTPQANTINSFKKDDKLLLNKKGLCSISEENESPKRPEKRASAMELLVSFPWFYHFVLSCGRALKREHLPWNSW
ncbi:hypothetical protein V6N12_067425 [Hibiscus sabdariffa]|uniref:Uncharacterized protein n=1 Tax=Hibiscus sabdariffa TaxID=183260 RepID=A0ABR1ZP76_9ROSI